MHSSVCSSRVPSGVRSSPFLSSTSTGLNLINCNHIHYSPSSALLLYVHTRYNLFAHSSCTSVFILIFINPQYTVLHILSHCTFYSLFYFIICSYFHSYSHLYLYIFSCVMCHCFFFFFFFTFHWADLSWLTFHYWLYPVWLCMWRIIKNLEPLNLEPVPEFIPVSPKAATSVV